MGETTHSRNTSTHPCDVWGRGDTGVHAIEIPTGRKCPATFPNGFVCWGDHGLGEPLIRENTSTHPRDVFLGGADVSQKVRPMDRRWVCPSGCCVFVGRSFRCCCRTVCPGRCRERCSVCWCTRCKATVDQSHLFFPRLRVVVRSCDDVRFRR